MIGPSSYAVGIVTQLLSPLFMTIGFIIWESNWIGSAYSLNLYKCSLGSVLFALIVVINTSSIQFRKNDVGYLLLSSTLGIVIGDVLWLEALRRIGARRVIVVDTIKPFAAAILGLCLLNEQLKPLAWVGMVVAVIGVLIVTLEKERLLDDTTTSTTLPGESETTEEVLAKDSTKVTTSGAADDGDDDDVTNNMILPPTSATLTTQSVDDSFKQEPIHVTAVKNSATVTTMYSSDICIGYIYAIVNALFDTFGTFLTKKYGVGMTIWEINLLRFGFAAICMAIFSSALWLFYSYTNKNVPMPPSNQAGKEVESAVDSEQPNGAQTHSNHTMIENESASSSCTQDPEITSKDLSSWYLLPNHMTGKNWFLVSLGVVFVTFLCPALSTYGLFLIPLGLALTLGSTGPLYALPLTFCMQQKKPTVAGCLGAVLAFVGIALFSVSGSS